MKNQDQQIYTLIQQLQHYDDSPAQKEALQDALNKLASIIPKLPGIYRDNNPRIDYQDAFNQALANIAGISLKKGTVSNKNILSFINTLTKRNKLDLEQIEPEKVRESLVNWFNKILKCRIIDLYRDLGKLPLSLDNIQGGDRETTYLEQLPDLTPNGFNILITEEELAANHNTEQELKQRFEDLKNFLNCHPDGYPHCTCHEIIKRRQLQKPPEKWKDMAKNLNIPQGTITSHWDRKCKPLLNQIPNLVNS
jgi:hypothetical protein